MLAIAGLLLGSALILAPDLSEARPGPILVAQPGPSPEAQPSPPPGAPAGASPVAKTSLATPTPSALADLVGGETGNRILLVVGAGLILVVGIAWALSNRQESTPSAEQLDHIREFVEHDFARQVAHGLQTAGTADGPALPSVANDPAWRQVFTHQLGLHNEFYRLSKSKALEVYTEHIDEAVRKQVAAAREQPADV
jgi:hypothetical protein